MAVASEMLFLWNHSAVSQKQRPN